MDFLTTLLDVMQKYGNAGLFLVLYLITVWYFFKELKARNAEALASAHQASVTAAATVTATALATQNAANSAATITERVVVTLEKSIQARTEQTEVLKELRKTIEETGMQTRELIAFLRGRDAGRLP